MGLLADNVANAVFSSSLLSPFPLGSSRMENTIRKQGKKTVLRVVFPPASLRPRCDLGGVRCCDKGEQNTKFGLWSWFGASFFFISSASFHFGSTRTWKKSQRMRRFYSRTKSILPSVSSLHYGAKIRSPEVLFCPPKLSAPVLSGPWFMAGYFSLFRRAQEHENSIVHPSYCQSFHP